MSLKTMASVLSAVLLCGALATSSVALASDSGNADGEQAARLGYPQDWSARNVVLAGKNTTNALVQGRREPRHVYNMVRRMVAERNQRTRRRIPVAQRKGAVKVDWSVSLENGFVSPNQFPAKYRFDVTTEDCSDYVLFALQIAPNKPAQGTIVGINNLYTEATPKCNNGVPWVAFSYNTVTHSGGQVRTSPVLSLDGQKVAFVESTSTGSYFHVLVLPNPIPAPPSQMGSVINPQVPTSCATPTVANCMSTLTISAAANSLSSPYVDYGTDTAYVATDDGKLYKIQPVFGGGAPALTADTANWPVTVVTTGASKVLTSPTLSTADSRIFIGDGNGYLYAVDTVAPAKATAARVSIGWVGHGAGTGIVDPPIVVNDSANPSTNQVFVTTGCSNIIGYGGAINQLPANFTSSSTFTLVDLGSGNGQGSCTSGNVHGAMFDDAFWISGSSGGHMMACGFVSGTAVQPRVPSNPKMYRFAFDANHLITSTGQTNWVITNNTGAECSPLTEFFDGTTDRLFFGVGNGNEAYIKSSDLTAGFPAPSTCSNGNPTATCATAPKALGGTSGIVIDNQLSNGGMNIYFSTLAVGSVNGQRCRVTGGTANPYCAVKLTQAGLQ
jgi:hypothetical protein